jgi:hypothetical protein
MVATQGDSGNRQTAALRPNGHELGVRAARRTEQTSFGWGRLLWQSRSSTPRTGR